MSLQSNNNKRIAKNTLLLYFGIYNVVGGIVAVIGLISVLYNAVIIEV